VPPQLIIVKFAVTEINPLAMTKRSRAFGRRNRMHTRKQCLLQRDILCEFDVGLACPHSIGERFCGSYFHCFRGR
jgi:hypothetical protein